jgi:transcriptional regulator with XRE-family HTH domain
MKDNDLELKFKNVLDFLKEKRKQEKVSQKEIADLLKIKQETYSRIEAGSQKMTAIQLIQIMMFFHENFSVLESIMTDPNYHVKKMTDTYMLQKHIEDCHMLIQQQQRIIDKLTSRERD